MSFNDIPIRRKLALVILITSSAVLLLAGTALIIYEFVAYKQILIEHVATAAQIAAEHSSAALAFPDQKAASETLRSLRLEVREACLYDKEGRIFARYPASSRAFPNRVPAKGSYVERNNIVVVLPVKEKGAFLGTLYVRSDFAAVYERISVFAGVVLLIVLGSFVVTVAMSSIFQKRISEPILELARMAHLISDKKDYSVRAPKLTGDELGTLTDAFNDMLSQIQQRDLEIRRLNTDLEQRVESRTEELLSTNKELEAFTYSVAHDLRAPLRHIDGYVQILLHEFASQLPADGQMYAARIAEGARNMGQLVDDLLNLARVGRQELNCQVTALQPIVNEVIASFRAETTERHIEWRVGELPFVDCDAGLMKQVFTNLLSNAIKYTRPRAQPIIEIGQTQINNEQAIFVRDNGVGFSMKYANKLFGVFQRLHRAEDFEGTGVGLATVDRIIRKHGGKVWAEAELDKGATFYFVLDKSQKEEARLSQ